ncbi:MAG: hypothetical protein U0235_15170 [Polyangiaceae bacterium]
MDLELVEGTHLVAEVAQVEEAELHLEDAENLVARRHVAAADVLAAALPVPGQARAPSRR